MFKANKIHLKNMFPFVIVSGFFNIRRDKWENFKRSNEEYYYYILNFLQIRAPIVFFTEENLIPMFSIARRNVPEKAFFISLKLENLPGMRYYKRFEEITQDKNYISSHPNPSAPEVCQPLYNVVTNSKIELVNAAREFVPADMYIWMDAGYSHGTKNLNNFFYYPMSLFNFKDKISIIQLRDISMASKDPIAFHRQYIDILAGGFFAISREKVKEIRDKYYQILEEIMEKYNIKDDDQYIWTIMYMREPELFNLIKGEWYSGLEIN